MPTASTPSTRPTTRPAQCRYRYLLEAGELGVPSDRPGAARHYPQPIGVVTLYPGISAEVIANILQQPVRALILLSLRGGQCAPEPAMLALLSEASARGVIIVNLSQCLHGKVSMGAMPPATPSPVRESSRL